MAAKRHGSHIVVELYENCGRATSHTVTVEIWTESKKKENAEFSREPYRIATCQICGEMKSQRMNNA